MTVIRRACAVDYTKRYAATADFCSILNNFRSKAPDWRIGEDVVLHRPKKQIRVVSAAKGLLVEKRVNGDWRTERQLKPVDWAEAIQMAEGL
jgi:ribosomal protein L1